MTAKAKLTMDRAARRFLQIAQIERALSINEAETKEAIQHVSDAKAVVKDLRDVKATLTLELHKAARDEGKLPLIDLSEYEE